MKVVDKNGINAKLTENQNVSENKYAFSKERLSGGNTFSLLFHLFEIEKEISKTGDKKREIGDDRNSQSHM